MRHVLTVAVLLTAMLISPAVAGEKLTALIIDGQNNHKWQKTTPVLRAILEQTGRFTVNVATANDPGSFTADFDQYDVVVSNYNGSEWPAKTKQAFEKYVRSGGGFVPVHAANNSFGKWDAYNEMIGLGGWGGRNEKSGPMLRLRNGQWTRDTSPGRGGTHGAQHEFVVTTHAPTHPIMKGLPTTWLHAKDELYAKLRGPAKNLTVLASAPSKKTKEAEPLLMVIDYGQGRVFHTALGHADYSMHGVGFQVTFARGAEWAATGKVTLPAPPADQLATDEVTYRNPLKN